MLFSFRLPDPPTGPHWMKSTGAVFALFYKHTKNAPVLSKKDALVA